MKRRAIVLALVLLVILAGNVFAAVNALNAPRYVIAGGGGRVAAGNYVLTGTIGQPVAGVVSQGTYGLCSGFWCGMQLFKLFLPIITK